MRRGPETITGYDGVLSTDLRKQSDTDSHAFRTRNFIVQIVCYVKLKQIRTLYWTIPITDIVWVSIMQNPASRGHDIGNMDLL